MKGTKWVTLEVDEEHINIHKASLDLYEALKAIINSETITSRDNFNNALEALAKAES